VRAAVRISKSGVGGIASTPTKPWPSSYSQHSGRRTWLAAADFNADGIVDLAVVNQTAPGTVSILLGQGDGTFQAAQRFTTGPLAIAVAVGDWNGDGIPGV
jgi:hypothetical protein